MCCRLHVHPSLLRLCLTAAYRTGKSVAKLQAHTDKICCESLSSVTYCWDCKNTYTNATVCPGVCSINDLIIINIGCCPNCIKWHIGLRSPCNGPPCCQKHCKVLGRHHLVDSGESFFTGISDSNGWEIHNATVYSTLYYFLSHIEKNLPTTVFQVLSSVFPKSITAWIFTAIL